jgi:hypothetical protein
MTKSGSFLILYIVNLFLICSFAQRDEAEIVLYILFYHIPVLILRLRENGVARSCKYFDVMSVALHKYSIQTC